MIEVREDGLLVREGGPRAKLELVSWVDGDWQGLELSRESYGFSARNSFCRVQLVITPAGEDLAYELKLESDRPTRLRLSLTVTGWTRDAFHLIPANIHGDNNLARAQPGHYPNLTRENPGNVSCSPYWEFRADRASHPVSILCFRDGVAAVSIDPYSDCPAEDNPEGFIRNGVFALLGQVCGVTLGYRNTPCTFLNKDKWRDPTQHLVSRATARGRIFLEKATSRLGAHSVIRRLYADLREPPSTPITDRRAAEALTRAFLTVNWHEDRENFTNMQCKDPEKRKLTAWRTLPEVGWTGGGVIGYPLLVSGHVLCDALAVRRGCYMLDWVSRAHNPASGLLWDVCGKNEGKRVDWWWSGYLVKGVHCAYTNGSGLYYLLKAYAFCKRVMGQDAAEWLATGLKALDTIVDLQEPDGNFGYTYSPERPQILDKEGFAGVWFVPALALAHELTGMEKYLRAAEKGVRYYHEFVRDLNCCGTPMDTWKSPEQEGNLGFIRGAALLHRIRREDEYLRMLEDGANYEYLWRYAFRARPDYPPLKGSHWNSCGGSVTSVSNPHIHPMGVFVSSDLRYLAEQTGDAYHAYRFEDGTRWAVNCVSLYPEVSGYGEPGVLTERFCPSDGLTIETFPDGSPSSLWFSYNGWAAAAVLEGLVEQMVP